MRKIVLFLLFGILGFGFVFAGEFVGSCPAGQYNNGQACVPENAQGGSDCTYDGSGNSDGILGGLQSCLGNSALVQDGTNIEGNSFATTLKNWTNTIARFLAVLAVFGIVFGGFRFTISAGEDEKITKAKNIIKWSIIGFVGVLTATLIINLVVNIMYSL